MNHLTQAAPAMALTQFLQENPTLPDATWTVDPRMGSLHGHLHNAGMSDLHLYAAVLGGAIRPQRDYECGGRMVRPHYLTTIWRDVPVTVVVVLPAPVASAVAA